MPEQFAVKLGDFADRDVCRPETKEATRGCTDEQGVRVERSGGSSTRFGWAVIEKIGTPGKIRTYDLLLRRQTLYPD
jgi:hypothetical protein